MAMRHKPTRRAGANLDSGRLREILGQYPTGVTIVCSLSEDGTPTGCTVSSFSPVSLDPPLVLFSLKRDSPSLEILASRGSFSINILAQDHGNLALHFARWQEDKFADVEWHHGSMGSPILSDAIAFFECSVWRVYDGGDHKIIVGEVELTDLLRDEHPLVVHQGEFRRVSPE